MPLALFLIPPIPDGRNLRLDPREPNMDRDDPRKNSNEDRAANAFKESQQEVFAHRATIQLITMAVPVWFPDGAQRKKFTLPEVV